jgi:hypothetical protein
MQNTNYEPNTKEKDNDDGKSRRKEKQKTYAGTLCPLIFVRQVLERNSGGKNRWTSERESTWE